MGRCLRAEGGDISFPSVQRRIFVLQSFEAIGLLWYKSSSAPLCLPCYAMHSNNIGKCSAPHWGRNVANKLHSCMESNVVCSLTIPIENLNRNCKWQMGRFTVFVHHNNLFVIVCNCNWGVSIDKLIDSWTKLKLQWTWKENSLNNSFIWVWQYLYRW